VRVLLISANFRPHVGGIERFSETLATGLAERGHRVEVICCRYSGAPRGERVDGIQVTRIPAAYVLDRHLNVPYPLPSPIAAFLSIRRALAKAEVVHVQDVLYATSFPSLALARLGGTPSVLTQHVGFVPQRSRALDSVEHVAFATLGRCARLATVVTALNVAVAKWVQDQWGIVDVRVLPVGVPEVAALAVDRAELRREFGLPQDRFLALFVGRDVPKKGLDIFLAAADPAYHLVAVTDRRQTPRDSSASILAFMPPDRLQALMQCIDAFVLPSEAEGFPVSMQEALASGLPVLTTFQSGYERYLADDDVLVVQRNPDSVRKALRMLILDEALRVRLSERARRVAALHFGIERFLTAYEELYAEVIEQASSLPDGRR
jgi:D-inositol-3-phosphate glycosyltransferase